jgi:hypothetical protein
LFNSLRYSSIFVYSTKARPLHKFHFQNSALPPPILLQHHQLLGISAEAPFASHIAIMFRLPPTRIAITDADLDNLIDPSRATVASHALNHAIGSSGAPPNTAGGDQQPVPARARPSLLSPINLSPAVNNMAGNRAHNTTPPLTQLPYDHLPYGPEREAIIFQNLHLSHLEDSNEQFNTQHALADATIENICTSHQITVDQLLAQLHKAQIHLSIHVWRQQQLLLDTTTTTTTTPPNPATDLLEKFADLRTSPISALAGVNAAESASDPGLNTEMDPPISTVLGIQGGSNTKWGHAGPLYGDKEDVQVVLAAEMGEAAAGAGSALGAGTDGLGLDELRADAAAGDEWVGGEMVGEEMEADARGAAGHMKKPRRGLLAKLKQIFKI